MVTTPCTWPRESWILSWPTDLWWSTQALGGVAVGRPMDVYATIASGSASEVEGDLADLGSELVELLLKICDRQSS